MNEIVLKPNRYTDIEQFKGTCFVTVIVQKVQYMYIISHELLHVGVVVCESTYLLNIAQVRLVQGSSWSGETCTRELLVATQASTLPCHFKI